MIDIERAAASGSEMPDDLPMPDQLLFLTLRELYSNFRSGAVNRSRGAREKQRIMTAYNGLKMEQKVMDEHKAIRNRLETNIGSLHKCGCEHCQKMLLLLDGIDRRDISEDIVQLNDQNDKLRSLVKDCTDHAIELRNKLDRVKWALEGDKPAEERLERIKEELQ